MKIFFKNPLPSARRVEAPVRETLARPLLTPGQDVPMPELPTRPRDVGRDLEAQWETAAGQVREGWQPSLQPISEQSLSPQQARSEGSSSGAIQHQVPGVPMVDPPSTHGHHGPDLEAPLDTAAAPGGGDRQPFATAAFNTVEESLAAFNRCLVRPNPNQKVTTTHGVLLFTKTESTIREPLSIRDKREKILESINQEATAKLTPQVPSQLSLATTDQATLLELGRVNTDAMAKRLQRNTELLQQLHADRTAPPADQAAVRQRLHHRINSQLRPTAFKVTAAIARNCAITPPGSREFADRQLDTVAATPEAHIEQGIRTLDLLSEASALAASLGQRAQTADELPEHADLRVAAENLRAQCEKTELALTQFASQYTDFVRDQLGFKTPQNFTEAIAQIANPQTSQSERKQLHAQVMTKVVAERRIEEALGAVTHEVDNASIRRLIGDLSAQDVVGREDQQITDVVTRLTDETDRFESNESAKQFLNKLAEMKGPPLDEVLRAHTGIYRTAWAPAAQAPADAPGKMRFEQARDMEKIHAELTSIALHVRAAVKTGKFQTQLDQLFDNRPNGPGAEVVSNFEESFQRLRTRQPGTEVTPQDKLNVKLAQCILDHGAAVKGLAENLQYTQERYVTDLNNSGDMLQMLRNGSTGASYDPVEQRANARTRLDLLRASVQEMDATREVAEGYGREEITAAIDAAKAMLKDHHKAVQDGNAQAATRAHAAEQLERSLFLMENYAREANATEPAALLRQLADNDPRCGTDAVIAENKNITVPISGSWGKKMGNGVTVGAGLDFSGTRQKPRPVSEERRNQVPNSLVLVESSAYSMKSMVNLKTTVVKGTLKANMSMGVTLAGPLAYSMSGGGGIGFERVTIQNTEPGIVCIVHKAPVLDGTASNAKIAGATHLSINDKVNQAFFSKPEVGKLRTVDTDIKGWDNLNRFFAATDRATLEPLLERKEVTTTLSVGVGHSAIGLSLSASLPEGETASVQISARLGASQDAKWSHSFRHETLRTATLEKETVSDTFSRTVGSGVGASMRVGFGYVTAREDEQPSQAASSNTDAPADVEARARLGSSISLGNAAHNIENAREYKELYKRVVRDQFGNEIPSLVRDSKTSTDGRLLVNNLVNEMGLISATVSQRIADGGREMSPLEKETVTKLLCLSTLASHFRNAGAFKGENRHPNDNLTINVTSALTPAAAARLAAATIAAPNDEDTRRQVLENNLNYSTIGAAGGFKNQNTESKVAGLSVQSKRSTSSAQSAGYPSGTDMLDHDTATALDALLKEEENRDIREALETVGMGAPLELLAQYEALTRPETPESTTA